MSERGNVTMKFFCDKIHASSNIQLNQETTLNQFKESLGIDMPEDLYHIYMTYDGQEITGVSGCFGTYRFYEYLSAIMFLPLKKALKKSQGNLFCIAASPYSELNCFIDLTGQLGKGKGAVYFNTGMRNTYLYSSSSITQYLTDYSTKVEAGSLEITSKLINSFE